MQQSGTREIDNINKNLCASVVNKLLNVIVGEALVAKNRQPACGLDEAKQNPGV